MLRRPVTILPLLVVLVACSPFGQVTDDDRQWTDDYVEATRYDSDEAREKLAELAETAPNDEKRRDAEFDKARKALRAGDVEAARAGFQSLWDEQIDDNTASRAIYELGRIAAEHDQDYDQARRLLHTAIVDTTPWAGSELALRFLVRTERNQQRYEPLVEKLQQLADDVEDDRMAAQLLLQRGKLLEDELKRDEDALHAWRAAYDRCEDCAATDEALFRMGKLYARHQNWQPAVDALTIVADRTQRSWFIGTYSSQRASDARLLLGEIEMLHRSDFDAAREHFEEFLSWFEDHSNAHHAAWHLVNIERLDGTERSYRHALEQFIDDYPRSRYYDEAKRQLEEMT